MWLSNVVVAAGDDVTRPGCWVEVVPTGRVRVPADGPPADAVVVDAGGVAVDPLPFEPIAEALVEAIVSGDREAAAALYADDLVVWHNHDGIERDRTESLELISNLGTDLVSFAAKDVRRDHLADGYVQRTTFHLVSADGADEQVDTMMRVWVRDAQITRIEEYAVGDSAGVGS